MKVIQVFPGSFYISVGDKSLLAGCPPEIVKVLIKNNPKAPDAILLPDIAVSQGESQVAVEFPLYHHLFFGKNVESGEPLLLVGNRRRVDAARELLDLSLFGPDEDQMVSWGMGAAGAKSLARETRWFQLKDADGKVLGLDRLIRTQAFANDEVELPWIKLSRVAKNIFQVSAGGKTETINLTPEVAQLPPYPVTFDLTTPTLVKLGVEVLGGSTGFSATQASSGLALCYNGNYILIDAIPFLNYHLRARGIASNQISAIFVSHIHDDHCNLVSLLHYNRRIEVLTTRLIFNMMLRKLALTLDRSEESLADYFTFTELTNRQATNFYGLRVTPFYSSHSVPTIGAHFETSHDGRDYGVTFTGDNQALADVKRMHQTGVISTERVTEIEEPYRRETNLLLADGGEGQIHGDPADALKSPAERIVFMHLDKLSERFASHFMTASSGKRFPVLPGDTDYNLTRTIEFLLEYFPGMPPTWISNLLANQHVRTFNADDIIIREGTRSEGYLYMILTGIARVVHHDGERKHDLATMEAGELIGEMSIISGQGQRNASVVALSPVTVTAISERSFREYIQHQNLEGELKRMWQNRELLQNFPYLQSLQQPVIRELSRNVSLEHLPARTAPALLSSFCEPHGLIFPLGKQLEIEDQRGSITIDPQKQPVMCHADQILVTELELQYLFLSAEKAGRLLHSIPAFRFFWEEELGLPIPVGIRI
jgi:CRP-like cAMP-binding protein